MDESEWARSSSASCPPPTDPPVGLPPAETLGLDPDWAEYVAQVDREMAADEDDGGTSNLGPWDKPAGPAESRDSWRPRFGQGDEADALPPGQLLVGLTETATHDVDRLSDDELVGVLQASRRQIAREQYKQVLATAEFGRRRQAAFEGAAAAESRSGCRPGGFPGEELAIELVTTRGEAGHRIDDAIDLTSRLPRTLAGMAAGDDRRGPGRLDRHVHPQPTPGRRRPRRRGPGRRGAGPAGRSRWPARPPPWR